MIGHKSTKKIKTYAAVMEVNVTNPEETIGVAYLNYVLIMRRNVSIPMNVPEMECKKDPILVINRL